MANESTDWLDDESMSAEETLRRFNALEPIEVTGPPENHPLRRGISVTGANSVVFRSNGIIQQSVQPRGE